MILNPADWELRGESVNPALGKGRQPGVLILLFIKRELEEIDDIEAAERRLIRDDRAAELVRPHDERAVASDFITFHCLSRRQDGGIANPLVLDFAQGVLAFF